MKKCPGLAAGPGIALASNRAMLAACPQVTCEGASCEFSVVQCSRFAHVLQPMPRRRSILGRVVERALLQDGNEGATGGLLSGTYASPSRERSNLPADRISGWRRSDRLLGHFGLICVLRVGPASTRLAASR